MKLNIFQRLSTWFDTIVNRLSTKSAENPEEIINHSKCVNKEKLRKWLEFHTDHYMELSKNTSLRDIETNAFLLFQMILTKLDSGDFC